MKCEYLHDENCYGDDIEAVAFYMVKNNIYNKPNVFLRKLCMNHSKLIKNHSNFEFTKITYEQYLKYKVML